MFSKSGCILAKWLFSDKVVVLGQNRLCLGKSGCIWEDLLFSAKVVVLWQSGCTRSKVIVFDQNGCSRVKGGCMRAKWL